MESPNPERQVIKRSRQYTVLYAVGVLAIVAVAVYAARRGDDARRTTSDHATRFLTALSTDWSIDTLRKWVTDTYFETHAEDDVAAMLEAAHAELGAFHSHELIDWRRNGAGPIASRPRSVQMRLTAIFDKGARTVELSLAKADGRWVIHDFYFDGGP